MFKLNIATTILRYYLMMAIAVIAVYTQQVWLIPVAMLVAVSAILGYRIGGPAEDESKLVRMKHYPKEQRRAS